MGKRRTIAAAAVFCLSLCGLEVALRAGAPSTVPTPDAPLDALAERNLAQYPLEYRQTYFSLRPSFDGKLWKGRFKTSSLGFRSPEVTPDKAPNQIRVVLMGTCITLGELDNTQHGYSAIADGLREILEAIHPGISFEVLNASVPGAYARQHLAQYEALIEPLEPDIVLLEAGTMHVTDPARMLRVLRDAPPPVTSVSHDLARPLHNLFARSAVIERLYDLQLAQVPFFDRHFRRQDLASEELQGKSQEELIELYQTRILEPGAKLYRRDLSALLTKLRLQAEVVTYPFTHGFPRTAKQVSFKQRERLGKPLVLDAPDEYARDISTNLALFHRSHDITQEVSAEVAETHGATHLDLQRDPALRRATWHHRRYYYLTRTEGSQARGRALARHLVDHYRFEVKDGRAVVARRRQ